MLLQINTDEAFGSGNNPAYQRKEKIFILWLPHITIKTRKLHFQACGVNVIYRVERDRWWSENLSGVQWKATTAASANGEYLPKLSKPDKIY